MTLPWPTLEDGGWPSTATQLRCLQPKKRGEEGRSSKVSVRCSSKQGTTQIGIIFYYISHWDDPVKYKHAYVLFFLLFLILYLVLSHVINIHPTILCLYLVHTRHFSFVTNFTPPSISVSQSRHVTVWHWRSYIASPISGRYRA